MIPEVRIRPMTAGDLAEVLALERSSESAPHWDNAAWAACLEDSPGQALRRIALTAEREGQVAGFAVLRLLTAPEGGEAELESIVVAPAMRGRGLGFLLMQSVLAAARAHRARKLELEVRASNHAAIRLYRRAGLAETARRRGYYRAPDEDAVLMSASL